MFDCKDGSDERDCPTLPANVSEVPANHRPAAAQLLPTATMPTTTTKAASPLASEEEAASINSVIAASPSINQSHNYELPAAASPSRRRLAAKAAVGSTGNQIETSSLFALRKRLICNAPGAWKSRLCGGHHTNNQNHQLGGQQPSAQRRPAVPAQ